ncbi:nucleoside 2-deoxyribosyltransferase [Enterococcus villorum]|uniref:Nucleoside deoxyribosyltransferase n=2 Tax=Enterococcus villorum TaxID=112904 RepID=A0A511IZX3_9ENTE|nr:nucleoside 2-deoxyribosyltransferase [Enterococcus villorum]EOH88997.1 nucleoside 2-deoxyribosyltransferase [Enterococcus villorum ATCC 700913]EOW76264.1 nucleoside 2-deoxyribosyltransferase [Enterococcus villorum ATCC 700913]GEL91318.1 nucleoside deoxyribosyltransferase [Enterococcus villorum]
MKYVYLAGPFFSEEQIDRIYQIEKALEENKTVTKIYSPRHHQESHYEMFSAEWAQEVYEKDMKELTAADLVVAILDYEHQIIDPGTAYELGAATMMKKPLIVFQEETVPTNLMITQSLHTYLKTVEEVRKYDFDTLSVTPYVGEFL